MRLTDIPLDPRMLSVALLPQSQKALWRSREKPESYLYWLTINQRIKRYRKTLEKAKRARDRHSAGSKSARVQK